MLADPVLGAQILNAFRTARKRYGAIIAASQGIEDFVGTAESPHTVGLAILQNTEAKFICAQLGELSRLRDVLHLSEPAVEVVKELRNVPGHFAESYMRSEEHTSELQSHHDLVCRLLLEKKNKNKSH